jgi:hypothetical protein
LYNNPAANYIPWSVFVWHWNYLTGVEENSEYFYNFRVLRKFVDFYIFFLCYFVLQQFATRQILAPFNSNIDNIVTDGTSHQER